MFEAIRNNRRVLLLLLVLLIFPAFAFFGISGYDRFFAGDNAVAVVEESPITVQQFNEARRAQIENMRRILGDAFDPALLDSPAAREQILEGLVHQRVLAVHATRNRIVVPNEALRDAIAQIPAFQDESGRFDMERYRAMLAAQGQDEMFFQENMRAELTLQTIPQVIEQSAIAPRQVARRIAAAELQERRFRTMRFSPADYLAQVDVDPAQARRYYEENPDAFRSAEAVKAEYLVLSQQALEGQVEVTDAEIAEYYQNNRARYLREAQRKARHILVQLPEGATEAEQAAAREKARSIRQRIVEGADFAEVAREQSDDPGSAAQGGDLGWFDRDTMTKPFADAAFTLAQGELSEPVMTEFGLHLIEVTDVREAEEEPLEKVRDEVVQAIRTQKARARFLELAEVFSNTVYEQPDSLAPAGDRIGLPVKTVARLERGGGTDEEIPDALRQPRVLRALFDPQSVAQRTNIEAIDLGDNTLVSARVIEHSPSTVKPFEAVEAEAISAVRAVEAAKRAREAGEAALAALREGKETQSAFGEERTATRSQSGLPPDAAKSMFSAPADGLPRYLGTQLGDAGYLITELLAVSPASEEKITEATTSFAARQRSALGGVAAQAYLDAVADGLEIEWHRERLAPAAAGN